MSFVEAAVIVDGSASRKIQYPNPSRNYKFSLYVFSSSSFIWAFEQDSVRKSERTYQIDLGSDEEWKVIMRRSIDKQVG